MMLCFVNVYLCCSLLKQNINNKQLMKACPIYTYLVMHLHKHTLTYINISLLKKKILKKINLNLIKVTEQTKKINNVNFIY